MTTAIDTNIISALWNADDTLNRTAQGALDAQFGRETLVISGVVYSELLAAPKQTESFLDGFCKEAGIGVDWELGERVLRVAGLAFQGYEGRRKKQTRLTPRRILAHFLIGAHALVNGYQLLALDEGIYRPSFPRLKIVAV